MSTTCPRCHLVGCVAASSYSCLERQLARVTAERNALLHAKPCWAKVFELDKEVRRMRPVLEAALPVVGAATLEHLETLRRAVKDYVNTAVAEPAAKGASSS